MTIGDESEEIETKSATNYCSTVDGPIVMKTMVDFGNDGDGSGYDGVQLGGFHTREYRFLEISCFSF